MSPWLIVYLAPILPVAYFAARLMWKDDGPRPAHQIQPHRLGPSLFCGIAVAGIWPFLLLLLALGAALEWVESHPGERVGRRLFGE